MFDVPRAGCLLVKPGDHLDTSLSVFQSLDKIKNLTVVYTRKNTSLSILKVSDDFLTYQQLTINVEITFKLVSPQRTLQKIYSQHP